MSKFYVVALTGQSGTGKSFASDYLATRGIPVIDGDVVAREVVFPGSRCLRDLVEEFGKGILTEDGSLDRRKLADISFSDAKRKAKLDAITHPYIIERMLHRFDELHREGYRYCVVEAAALVESGLYANCDRIVLITSKRALQVERIMRRDGITEAEAETRIAAQVDDSLVRSLADYEIENNGGMDAFIEKLDALAVCFEEWFTE